MRLTNSMLLIAAALAPLLGQALPDSAGRRVDFSKDIAPLLKRCQGCHGRALQTSGLRLDRAADALRGGYSGPAIIAGDSANSKLIHMVAGLSKDAVMPPNGPRLTAESIGLLRAWIDQGVNWPESAAAGEANAVSRKLPWAFQPISKPSAPQVKNRAWVRNPIDAFILAKLERENVAPSPNADPDSLARRLFLDITGVPPAPSVLNSFVADPQPEASDAMAEKLLRSPQFGEKWARHWLDLAHYADSDGYQRDRERPFAWRWRQWVIEALNNDMPFDQFTVEQLAGDLSSNREVSAHVATGFLRNTLTNREDGSDPEEFRVEQVADRVETTGTVWLGLTIGCAKCHDHKYDPISQKDYYRFFAFFNSAKELNIDAPMPGEVGPYLQAYPDYEQKRLHLIARHKLAELQRKWESALLFALKNPGKNREADIGLTILHALSDGGFEILTTPPAKRSKRQGDYFTDYFISRYTPGSSPEEEVISAAELKDIQFDRFLAEWQALKRGLPPYTQAMTIAESAEPRRTQIHIRGDFRRPGIPVDPGVPEWLPQLDGKVKADRLALARWLVSSGNPLTARVFVNRVWQEYFGAGLVRTSENFGTQGEPPSHPELLDWLASEFIESGWNVKHVHRLIVNSSTYRQSSRMRPELAERDPENTWLARQNRLRLSAESIRDSALAVSGLLSTTIGGPSVFPPQPAGADDGNAHVDKVKWRTSSGTDRYRRGLYIHFQRTTPYPQLMVFDAPDSYVPCSRRRPSNMPTQALNLLNDEVFMEAARALAHRIIDSAGPTFADRLNHAFRLTLARDPSQTEREYFTAWFLQQRTLVSAEPGLMEKIFPVPRESADRAEAAAWVGFSRVMLNLDEFITRE